jgi:hypothetical protein
VPLLVRHLRAHVVRYAVALAVCQALAVCSATIVLAAAPHAGGALAVEEECTCEHSAGVMCPMHRRSSSRPVPVDAPKWCQGVDDSLLAALPVLGTLALPERIAQLVPTAVESLAPSFRAEAPRPLDRPPDSPPPRG